MVTVFAAKSLVLIFYEDHLRREKYVWHVESGKNV